VKTSSLGTKLLGVALVLCLTATGLCAATGFWAFKSNFVHDRAIDLDMAVTNRAQAESSVFVLVERQAAAGTAILNRPQGASAAIDQQFEQRFPERVGAVRYGGPRLFTGQTLPDGDTVFGIGARIADADAQSVADRALLLRAFDAVRLIGESRLNGLDNLDFDTVAGTVIAFNSAASDQFEGLKAWDPRKSPPTMVVRAGPLANPQRRTQCARLVAPVTADGKTVGTAMTPYMRSCTTPAYVGGRYVGVWHTTIDMQALLPDTAGKREGDAEDFLLDAKGELVAVSGRKMASLPTAALAKRYKATFGLAQLAKAFARTPAGHGVTESPDHRWIIGFAALDGAPWYLVTAVPKARIEAAAAGPALLIVGVGALALLTTSLLIFVYARREIVDPLCRLAAHSARARSADGAAAADGLALEHRTDEIGELARRLAEERALADSALQSLEERVAERTAELERANRAKSTFLANMSHELRTPLNGVVALSDILANRLINPENRVMAELVVSSARLLEQVLTDILDVSKIEAGQMTLCVEPFDLEPTVERIAALHKAAAQAKASRVELTWSVDEDAKGRYLGDQVRITQILSNLLSNAVKFTAEGEVALTVEAAPGGLRMTVRDSGVGFSQEIAERLFRRFEQADASTTRQYGGTGLGLSICASLCELMGGSIHASSAPGEGATFVVELPLARAEAGAEARATDAAGALANLEGLRVLQAEDHPTNQKVVALSLEPFGVDLTTVENGALAVEAAAQHPFDVILMDLHMPVMDGLAAIGHIRAHEARTGAPRTPIVALTADALTEQVKAALGAGADMHLAKPIRPKDLIMAIVGLRAAHAMIELRSRP